MRTYILLGEERVYCGRSAGAISGSEAILRASG